ncbi:MAG: ExeM/NucH family extracellular endonuclease [Nocardioides sp.]
MSALRRAAALLGGLSLLTGGLAVVATSAPATADPAGTDLVISEVYGAGGNDGSNYTHDYVELYNPTSAAINVDGWSVQYRSATGTSANVTNLDGQVAPGRHYLVTMGAGAAAAVPTPDATGSANMSGAKGVVLLVPITTGVSAQGNLAGSSAVVDAVGFGTTPTTFEARTTGVALTATTSAARSATGGDLDDNEADFTEGAPTPTNSTTGGGDPEDPPTGGTFSIAEIQGTGAASPLAGQTVTTRGVVTAAYPTGDFFAFVIQTEGTGGTTDATPGASDALWAYQSSGGVGAEIGQHVEVTGVVADRFGRTQLTYDPSAGALKVLSDPFDAVIALATSYWPTESEREAHESELLDLSGQEFTVTNNYSTNQFGEIGLATGDRPLVTPTEVANPNLDPAGYQAVVADNFARGVVLDDGSSWNYVRDDTAQEAALPWLDRQTTARVGASAALSGPVVLDYGFSKWRLQPTRQVNGAQPGLVTFGDTRPDNLTPQVVGGDLRIATFNVLNYFNTTGMDFVDSGRGTCSYFTDRAGDEVTNNRCSPDGPRGAAEDEDLANQQIKIVEALNSLDASVVSLEEIENSVKLGEPRDDALAALTEALNQDAGTTRWAFVPSPPADELPAVEDQDVIRNAFIYDPSVVQLAGGSKVLVDSPAFSNARQPLAQAFKPVGTTPDDAFAVVVNHFKSKGSACTGEPNGPQGNCNQSRTNQARALAVFADEFAQERGIEQVYLTGDFNSYSQEDPMIALERAGYTALDSDTPDEWSYSFDGMSGSLDHVLANDAALAEVTGVDIWEINANEALAFEYSRFNYNVTQFYEANVFRASDHNPELVGIDVRDASEVSLTLSPDAIKQKRDTSTASVTVSGVDEPTGTVRFYVDGVQVGQRALLDGTAEIRVGPFDKGRYTVTVEYLGDDDNLPGTDTATLVVGND